MAGTQLMAQEPGLGRTYTNVHTKLVFMWGFLWYSYLSKLNKRG